MSGKVKMRCARCGKPFKSSNARQTLCSECEAKERAARAAVKNAPKPAAVGAAPAIAPKIVGPGAGILDPRLAAATPAPAPTPVAAPAAAGAPAPYPPSAGGERHGEPRPAGRPASPATTAGRPQEKRPPREPKKRTPKPATRPFELTDDLRAKVEARYLELAQPVEYDGIRSKIATELNIPKAAVKKAVLELRQRMQMPSWWELQAYAGTTEDLERIRAVYMPLLPVAPVGVHKQIATDLGLDASVVYQGIRRLRAELRLPQYNPPDLHEAPEAAMVAQPGGEAGADT
ncbi:MAG TPA: hypothetical protein VLJ14_07395 [Ktedonobacterales bacterium]|nr:hypothetical protein [Ktedonobacterales bacterium]